MVFPDIVVNVVDASNLDLNLYLTTQLIDMDIRVVIALNMYDELQKKGGLNLKSTMAKNVAYLCERQKGQEGKKKLYQEHQLSFTKECDDYNSDYYVFVKQKKFFIKKMSFYKTKYNSIRLNIS